MGTERREVDIYFQSGRWCITVAFRRKWQALAFHLLLNASLTHVGKRGY